MEKKKGKKEFGNVVRIQIPSHPRFASIARNFIFQIAREEGFGYYESADIKLITGEAIHYITKYAYKNRVDLPIFIEVMLLPGKMEIRIRDFGEKLEESKITGYDLSDYRFDGLGMYIIKNLADHFYLDTSLEKGNQIILMKLK